MQNVDNNSVRNESAHLFMADEEVRAANNQNQIQIEEEVEAENVEQLIKDDAKTSSGVSISNASTHFQTQMGSQISSGAAAATSASASALNPRQSQGGAAAVVVPPSFGATTSLSVLNEENHSEIAFNSQDGATSSANFRD